jgi:predicted aspartyl protease
MSDDMGLLRTDVEIESPLREGDRRLLRDVLVDTGAELSWAPAAVLESLGIRRRKPIRFQQADGTILERWVGFVILHAGGTFTNDEIVFGEPGDLVLLGARSLEGLNLKVDLVGKRLVSAGPMLAAAALSGGDSSARSFLHVSHSAPSIADRAVVLLVSPRSAATAGAGRNIRSLGRARDRSTSGDQ